MVADVRATDQEAAQPRDDQDGTAVRCRLVVEGAALGSSGERVHDQVSSLGPADERAMVVGQVLEQIVGPGTRGVDRDPGPGRRGPARELVGVFHADHPRTVQDQAIGLRVSQDLGPVLPGGEHVLDAEALRVIHLGVVEQGSTPELLGHQPGGLGKGLRLAVQAVPRQGLVERQDVIGDHPGPEHPGRALVPPQERHQERQRLDQVRRGVEQPLALSQRLADQVDLEVLEIADPAVDHAAVPGRGGARDVVLLDQQDRQSAHGGVARDGRAVDAGAQHDDVELNLAPIAGP